MNSREEVKDWVRDKLDEAGVEYQEDVNVGKVTFTEEDAEAVNAHLEILEGDDEEPQDRRKYRAAPEVEEVARALIEDHHSHLVEARIGYLFRRGAWKSRDKTVAGKAYKVSERDKLLTGLDFIIVMNLTVWQRFSDQ